MVVATQVARVLTDTKLIGSTINQVRRYGFMMLKLETEFKEVLDYLTALLLCSGRGGELWQAFSDFKKQTSVVWKMLTEAGVKTNIKSNSHFPDRKPLTLIDDHNESAISTIQYDNTLLNLLEAARPAQSRQARSPILVGLGLGFLGNFLLGTYFGKDNSNDIDTLNRNIHKQNKNIRVTNERIDILAKNVSDSVDVIKKILDKLIEAREKADIHYAIQWNLDQLVASITNVRNTFKFGELTVTLLKKGIINAELIDLKSFQKIITEGRKSFPKLYFPLDITRFQLKHIIKILKIQNIGHLKFMMIIPLTRKQDYRAFSLIPHPVKLGPTDLVLPELKDILLVNNHSYIITNNINVYSISLTKHLLLDVEPIYNKQKSTCEWEGFKQNTTRMMAICNYNKVGKVNDTFVVETDQHRLVYFSELTKVTLGCPTKQVRENLIGLHKLPLACDIETKYVFWPAKQTITVTLNLNETTSLDSTALPIINVNKTSKIHKSLRELLAKLPKEDDSFTINFDKYGLSLEAIQSYSIYAQSCLSIIVIINSLIIGFFIIRKLYTRKRSNNLPRSSYARNKFRKVRDSMGSRRNSFDKRDFLRNARNSIRSRSRNLRDSIRSKSSSIKEKIKNTVPISPKLKKMEHSDPSSTLNTPTTAAAATNTNINWQLPSYAPPIYPALPRYT